MKRRVIDWQPEELAWIEAHKEWPRDQLYRAFCTRFNRTDVLLGALTSLCKRNGWKTGRTGYFPPGQAPANKGRKMSYNAQSAATQFRKGGVPRNVKYAGHERVDKHGYVWISVAETNPHTGYERRYVQKHRRLWEEANGPVPEGMRLKCLDGDRTNCDPANWEALPRGMAPRLNGIRGRGYDTAPAELKPVIMAIAKLAHQAKEVAHG